MPLADINGIRINYKVEGQGEPLIMISGFNSKLNSWFFQIPAFKRHFRVITFDNRGAGKSDKPKEPYLIRVMIEDTLSLMNYLDIQKAHIRGDSMGGMIAQELVINFPE